MTFDLYVWKEPRDLDADEAAARLARWREAGADPAASPFEPSTDVGWFHRELTADRPALEISSDAIPSTSTSPIWLSGTDEPPARMVALRVRPDTTPDDLENVYSLAMKYDLVLFEPRRGRLRTPLAEMSQHASATFWPAGAVQAAVGGGIGAVAAVGAWLFSIPIVSGIVVLIGGFMALMSILTFVAEARKRLRRPGGGGGGGAPHG